MKRERGGRPLNKTEFTNEPCRGATLNGSNFFRVLLCLKKLLELFLPSDLIQPICLPNAATRLDSLVGEEPYVAGWGRRRFGEYSNYIEIGSDSIRCAWTLLSVIWLVECSKSIKHSYSQIFFFRWTEIRSSSEGERFCDKRGQM